MKKLRISFDIGGCMSKYPSEFRRLIRALSLSDEIEIFVITDMHDHEKCVRVVHDNGFDMIPPDQIHSANYSEYGEYCKAYLIESLGIDIHIDDFPGYCAHNSCVNLLVFPNPNEPYYSDSWKTDGSEGSFGRRTKSEWRPR